MQSDIPKPFMLLKGRPILMRTIEAFYNSEIKPEIIVALNVDFHQYWEQLCKEYNFTIHHHLIRGGGQRFHSVKNALKSVKGTAIVAIHDAVRPLVNNDLITESFRQAELNGNAVAAIRCSDSVRQINENGTVPLNREEIYLIQTPQTFRSDVLNKAYKQDYRNEFTDDASVVEKSGVRIQFIEGNNQNLKITFPADILLAEFYLDNKH